MGKETTVKKSTSVVYSVCEGDYVMGSVAIQEVVDNPSATHIIVSSQYGDYNYTWGSPGSKGMHYFLASLNKEYVAKKFDEDKFFSLDKSLACFMPLIAEVEDEDIRQQCEAELAKLTRLCSYGISVGAYFRNFISCADQLAKLVDSPEACYEISPRFLNFWDKIWLPFLAHLKSEEATS